MYYILPCIQFQLYVNKYLPCIKHKQSDNSVSTQRPITASVWRYRILKQNGQEQKPISSDIV